ncbi:MAG: glycosyl hydrolase family 95 catalytic domain-containing protein [bacterium]|jgi:alpha-L-fucosidase 2
MMDLLHLNHHKLFSHITVLISFLALSHFAYCQTDTHNLTLWYNQPADEWVEALPVGNGRLGAMVYGGVAEEQIQFNEDTLWTGVPRDYINPKALETLPRVRQLLFEGKQAEAERVARDMMSVPMRQDAYQPFGTLAFLFPDHQNYENYRRTLNLTEGIATVSYQVGDVTYQREVFSSYPDQAIVVHLSASQPGKVNVDVKMQCPHPDTEIDADSESERGSGVITLSGQLKDRVDPRTNERRPSILRFSACLDIQTDQGSVTTQDETVKVRNADSVTFKLLAATSYKNYRDIGNDPVQICEDQSRVLAGKTYEDLKNAHIADYQNLFQRVSIDLGVTDAVQQPTDERIKKFSQQHDPQLVALYYQYGRYLLISSSRPGSQPANLQGIWNDQLEPPWDSKWTTNINTEMNYWIAEMGNLSECHEPLFAMLEDLVITGGRVAREHYNCRGWVLHHNTDVWRGAAPINATDHGIWMTGGAWLCQHLWWRYEYTQDEEFLRNRAYPIMKGAALFFVDFLIEDPRTGWLISTPSNSPELGGLVAGPTMDHQIIRNLFSNTIAAAEILEVDEDFRELLREKIQRIAPNQIGRYGQLQEWLEDKDDPNEQHRHVSHLWALHPGNEITPLQTAELAEACKVTLQHRGDGGTGWSKAWKVNFRARLHDGNHAYRMLSELISKSTLPNMFDTHPPFQIDGNFGGASGINEMLLQSHTGEIHLLPALPDALPDGFIQGICVRGGFVVDLKWEDHKVKQLTILSKAGNPLRVRYLDQVSTIATEAGKTYQLDDIF